MTFAAGQKVWHRNGKHSGTVLECDGDRVFITGDNGAELDFRASDLTAVTPSGPAGPAKDSKEARGVSTIAPNRALTAGEITPEHARVLAAVPVRTLRAVADVFEGRVGAGRFNALGVAAKLNAVAEITAVPYRTMREYSDRPGELGLLMGKGLADSRRGGS